jgi:hypothetical protein
LSLAGALILLAQVLEIWTIAGTLSVKTQVEWRVSFLGAFASRIPLMVLADIVLYTGIVYQGSRAALRRMGWVHLAITGILGIVLLYLVAESRALLRTAPSRLVLATALRAIVLIGITALLTLLAGWFSVRHSHRPKWVGRKRTQTPLLTDTEETRTPNRG